MKTQRKLLTDEQKKAICKKSCCITCPLMMEISYGKYCFQAVMGIEQDIKDFWNEEIEVDL